MLKIHYLYSIIATRELFTSSNSFVLNVAPNIDWCHEVTDHEGGEYVNKTTRFILEVQEEIWNRYVAITARNTSTANEIF